MSCDSITRRLRVGLCEVAITVTDLHAAGPPVVFVSALGTPAAAWDQVRSQMQSTVTVVTYGRPALDGSDRLPAGEADVPRPVSWAAEQLHTLIDVAGLGAPVLVGHSIGGAIIERLASGWPNEVAGLVLVDPSDMRVFPQDPLLRDGDDTGAILFDTTASQRHQNNQPAEPLPGPATVLSSAVGRWHQVPNPERYLPLTPTQLDKMWQETQHKFAAQLDADLVIAHTAGHRLEAEAPHLVAYLTDAVVEAASTHQRGLHLDPQRLDAAGGYLASRARSSGACP